MLNNKVDSFQYATNEFTCVVAVEKVFPKASFTSFMQDRRENRVETKNVKERL